MHRDFKVNEGYSLRSFPSGGIVHHVHHERNMTIQLLFCATSDMNRIAHLDTIHDLFREVRRPQKIKTTFVSENWQSSRVGASPCGNLVEVECVQEMQEYTELML